MEDGVEALLIYDVEKLRVSNNMARAYYELT
jgi:hypothetical protein